jgi:hypothetical protein
MFKPSGCNVECEMLTLLSQRYGLVGLDLSSNNIVGNLCLELWDLSNLAFLTLSNNKLEGALPQKICNIFLTSQGLFLDKLFLDKSKI